MDYEVFEPENERIARFVVRFLWDSGYYAGYQLGYLKNKVFVRVDTEEEAKRISVTIRGLMEKFKLTESELTLELKKPINTSKPLLKERENVANITAHSELESEKTEPQELETERIELELEEPEPEPTFELNQEPEQYEPEELELKETKPGLGEPEPELEEPEPILGLEPEPEQFETEPILKLESGPETKQKKSKPAEEPFSFKTF
jgi:hypothetical protein